MDALTTEEEVAAAEEGVEGVERLWVGLTAAEEEEEVMKRSRSRSTETP
jgi:hypothetical protein